MAEPALAQQASTPLDPVTVVGGTASGEDEVAAGAGVTTNAYKRDRVSSEKFTAPLLDTPQTVTVVTEELIKEQAATSLTDVLRTTPGISFNAGENGFGANDYNFQLRGMDGSHSVFVDGSRDNGSYRRDSFNIEEVEIVKGAAADNGRGGGAGYVNIVTKKPKTRDFTTVDTSVGFDDYGTDPLGRVTVDMNRVDGNVAVRLNGMAEGGGFYGRDVADIETWGLAPSIAFGLNTDFRMIVSYEHLEQDNIPDWGILTQYVKGVGPNPFVPGYPRDRSDALPTDFDRSTSNAGLVRFEYDINEYTTISNQSRIAYVDRDAEFRLGGSPATSRFYDRENETLTNWTSLVSEFNTGRIGHTISTGLEFTRETSDAFRQHANPALSETNKVTVETAAVYFYDTMEFGPRWEFTGGVRVEHLDVGIDSKNATTGASTADDGFRDDDVQVGWKAGLVYKPRPQGSVYGAYSLSYLPHGALLSNPDISRTGANALPGFVPGADPVEAHNYEVGIKWDFLGGALSATGALFRTEKKNVAYDGDIAAGDPAIVYGEQIIQGLELGLAGEITPAWKMFAGLVLLDTERKHGPEVDRALDGDFGANAVNGFPAVLTVNGEELAFTPEVTANLWTTYRWDNGLTLGGGLQYVGESWIGRPDDALRVIPNGKFGKLPDYFLVNLMAAYELRENVTVQFNIDNVFDELYMASTNWNGTWGHLGAPRVYRIATNFSF